MKTNERHVLYHRPIFGRAAKMVKAFQTLRGALVAGMSECGHGKFWVSSERKSQDSKSWTAFVPPQPTMAELVREDI